MVFLFYFFGKPEGVGWILIFNTHYGVDTSFFSTFFWTATFSWCRSLRPYPISSYSSVPAHIELPDWAMDVSYSFLSFRIVVPLHIDFHFPDKAMNEFVDWYVKILQFMMPLWDTFDTCRVSPRLSQRAICSTLLRYAFITMLLNPYTWTKGLFVQAFLWIFSPFLFSYELPFWRLKLQSR